jgi:hypothetical protein
MGRRPGERLLDTIFHPLVRQYHDVLLDWLAGLGAPPWSHLSCRRRKTTYLQPVAIKYIVLLFPLFPLPNLQRWNTVVLFLPGVEPRLLVAF